jgi:hypothetical protein
VWYCRNDDACFCDAHKVSVHAAKSLSKHTIVPVAERVEEIPKCPTHKAKDLDMWCTLCNTLCCYMCAQFGKHKEHQGCLAPVENAAFERRNKLKLVAERTQQLSSIQMDQTALNLVSLRNEFESSVEGTARAIDKLADSVTQAVSARANELHEEARKQGAAGLKNLQLRIDDLSPVTPQFLCRYTKCKMARKCSSNRPLCSCRNKAHSFRNNNIRCNPCMHSCDNAKPRRDSAMRN